MTRDSVLALAREHAAGKSRVPDLTEKLVVSERPVTMQEVKAAAQDGSLVEFFGTGTSSPSSVVACRKEEEGLILGGRVAGTAAVISPVDRIGYLGEDLHIPTGPDGMGPVSRPLWKLLTAIQTGAVPHPWSVVVA